MKYQTIKDQQNHRPADGRDETHGVLRPVPAKLHTNPFGDKRAGDAQQRRDDEPAGISSRHEELGNNPDQQTDKECSYSMHTMFDYLTCELKRRADHNARYKGCAN